MYPKTTEQKFLGAQIPANYHGALRARAEREDRSVSSVVRSALAVFLYGEAGSRALTELEQQKGNGS